MPLRVLFVDDEEPILFAVNQYFSTLGYKVDCARDRGEAEAYLGGGRYAGVIADLRLSEGLNPDGLDIVQLARERDPSTCTIILTAYGSPQVEREARRRGVGAFVEKPVSLVRLAQIVSGLISARRPGQPEASN